MAAGIRGATGVVPFGGAAIGELLTAFIPHQREERLVAFCRALSQRVGLTEREVEVLTKRIRTLEGGLAVEEVMIAGSRTISDVKHACLARLLNRILTEEEASLREGRRVAEIVEGLDEEDLILLWFKVSSEGVGLGSPWLVEAMERHSSVLQPTAVSISSADPADLRRNAMQSSYEQRLEAAGLLRRDQVSEKTAPTPLGRMVLEYVSGSGDGALGEEQT